MEGYWKEKEKLVNQALSGFLKSENKNWGELLRWMRYSTLAKGKRIRALLVLITAEMLGKDPKKFLPSACGLEMIHTSSLILDDLPCMDDAVLRRGKPALHRVSGEANAILSSYALLMKGIELIAYNAKLLRVNVLQFERIIKSITLAVGIEGISLGQFLDLKYSDFNYSREEIEKVHLYKTASLFISTLEITGILAGIGEKKLRTLKNYGKNLGLAFQIRDDFLEKRREKQGKYSLKDGHRPNYRRLLGKEKTRNNFLRYKQKAIFNLRRFGKKAEKLKALFSFLDMR
ncbi:MAG: polyprenyl synthetase family protein [Candidatus Omnitrophica bacterium]|nr:polyprenyl synthetase family protein [Candidatus Omnitrophota bacterium]